MDLDSLDIGFDGPDWARSIHDLEGMWRVLKGPRASSLSEVRSGIIAWDVSRHDSVELKFLEQPDLGMYLAHRTWQARRMTDVFLSVGDRDKLSADLMMDLDEDGFALPGLFIPVEQAWLGIEDFFEDPLTLSPRIDWIDAKDLPPWPEP